jgi:hypothetical protein
MSDPNLPQNADDRLPDTEPTILRNEIGKVPDPTVVVDEADRTVLLTDNETIIIEKQPHIDLPPKNRPRKVYKGMWGPVEAGVVGAGLLVVLGAVLLYVFFVSPSNRELEANRARRDRLEAELASSQEKYGNISNVETQVAKLISSVNDFEAQYLPVPTTGRTALYQRINGLIAAYGLENTSGPDYGPLDILEKVNQENNDNSGGKSKFRSFFPGVYVSMTVEGPYANLRRFLSEIETGDGFIVVSAVELEPSDAEAKPDSSGATVAGVPDVTAGPNPAGYQDPTTIYQNSANRMMPNQITQMPQGSQAPQSYVPESARGKTHGSVVSLRIEMAAYFRRPSVDPAATAVQQ